MFFFYESIKNLTNKNIIFGTTVLFLLSSTFILQALLVYICTTRQFRRSKLALKIVTRL